MNIAMIEQSQVDAYLDRIHRFADSVYQFRDRLNELVSEQTPQMAQPSEPVSLAKESVSYEPSAPTETKPVTADDIDIDAILNGITIDDDLTI